MSDVSGAIASFNGTNKRLPCPADPTLPPTDPNFGLEVCPPGSVTVGSCTGGTTGVAVRDADGFTRTLNFALAGLRDVAFERSAYARAVKLGERVVRERPRAAEDRLRLGDSYLKVLRYHDALEQYELAHALGEDRADWRIDKVRKKLGVE